MYFYKSMNSLTYFKVFIRVSIFPILTFMFLINTDLQFPVQVSKRVKKCILCIFLYPFHIKLASSSSLSFSPTRLLSPPVTLKAMGINLNFVFMTKLSVSMDWRVLLANFFLTYSWPPIAKENHFP